MPLLLYSSLRKCLLFLLQSFLLLNAQEWTYDTLPVYKHPDRIVVDPPSGWSRDVSLTAEGPPFQPVQPQINAIGVNEETWSQVMELLRNGNGWSPINVNGPIISPGWSQVNQIDQGWSSPEIPQNEVQFPMHSGWPETRTLENGNGWPRQPMTQPQPQEDKNEWPGNVQNTRANQHPPTPNGNGWRPRKNKDRQSNKEWPQKNKENGRQNQNEWTRENGDGWSVNGGKEGQENSGWSADSYLTPPRRPKWETDDLTRPGTIFDYHHYEQSNYGVDGQGNARTKNSGIEIVGNLNLQVGNWTTSGQDRNLSRPIGGAGQAGAANLTNPIETMLMAMLTNGGRGSASGGSVSREYGDFLRNIPGTPLGAVQDGVMTVPQQQQQQVLLNMQNMGVTPVGNVQMAPVLQSQLPLTPVVTPAVPGDGGINMAISKDDSNSICLYTLYFFKNKDFGFFCARNPEQLSAMASSMAAGSNGNRPVQFLNKIV